jgi:hypothetical protein
MQMRALTGSAFAEGSVAWPHPARASLMSIGGSSFALAEWEERNQDLGGAFFSKAEVTSSFSIRAPGVPGWLRFCSSVPSPIIPVCLSADFLSAGSDGLLVMASTPCAGALEQTKPPIDSSLGSPPTASRQTVV